MMSLSLSLLLLLCDSAFRTHGFNLETRLPIVKRSLEVSYFGYSVAGHQSYDEIKLQVENSWLVYLLFVVIVIFCYLIFIHKFNSEFNLPTNKFLEVGLLINVLIKTWFLNVWKVPSFG